MPTYVMLANWTDQGMRAIGDSPRRVDAAKKTLEEMGGQFRSVYMTMGDVRPDHDLRRAGRCGGGALHPDARQARQCAHHVAEGVPRGGVPPDRQLAALSDDRRHQPDARREDVTLAHVPPALAGRAWSAGMRFPALRHYMQDHVIASPAMNAPAHDMRIDGFPILWFDNDADRQRAHVSPEMAACNVDSRSFIGAVSRVICEPQVVLPQADARPA